MLNVAASHKGTHFCVKQARALMYCWLMLSVFFLCLEQAFASVALSQKANDKRLTAAMHNILLGEFSAWRGQLSEALGYYQAYLNELPDEKIAERVTRLALHNKDYPAMFKAAGVWVSVNPKRAEAHFFHAISAVRTDQYDVALSEMTETLRLGGTTDFTRLINSLRAVEFSQSKEAQAVLALYDEKLSWLLRDYSKSYDIPLALALLAIHRHDRARAREMALLARQNGAGNAAVLEFSIQIFEAVNDEEETKESYIRLLNVKPNSQRIRYRYALYLTDKDHHAAIEQLQMLAAAQPQNGHYLFHLALVYIEASYQEKAITLLRQLRLINSHADDANYYLGLLSLEQDSNVEAEFYLQQVESSHLLEKRYQALLQLYFMQKKYDKAYHQTELLESVLLNEQGLVINYFSQSSLLTLQGKYDAAIEVLDKVIRIDAELSQSYYRQAIIYNKQGSWVHSEQAMHQFLLLEPENADAMHLLAQWLVKDEEQLAKALMWLRKASRVKPDSVAILDDLGWVLYQLGHIVEAKSYLAKAQLLSEDADITAHFAEVLWRSGEQGRAETLLREAYAQSPSDQVLADTIRRLDVVFD